MTFTWNEVRGTHLVFMKEGNSRFRFWNFVWRVVSLLGEKTLVYFPSDPTEFYDNTDYINFQILLSSILHFTNNFIQDHAIQSSILYFQFWPSMPQSISTAYTLPGNNRENFLIGKILATKAILWNVLVLRQIEAPFFLLFHQLFAFSSYSMLFDIKCSPSPVHLRTVTVT